MYFTKRNDAEKLFLSGSRSCLLVSLSNQITHFLFRFMQKWTKLDKSINEWSQFNGNTAIQARKLQIAIFAFFRSLNSFMIRIAKNVWTQLSQRRTILNLKENRARSYYFSARWHSPELICVHLPSFACQLSVWCSSDYLSIKVTVSSLFWDRKGTK